MYRYIIALLFAVLTTAVTLAQQQNIDALQIFSEECGVLRPDQFYNLQKIVEENEYPWMGRLKDGKNEFICIVILISKQYVLSAAHCFDFGPREDAYIVELGNCKIRRKCRVLSYLETFVQHPYYVENQFKLLHDISLLRLNVPVTFTDYIQPICLPSADVRDMDYVAQHLTMTGRQVRGGIDVKFQVLIVDMTQCQKLYKSFTINETVICASTCDNGANYYVGSALMGVSVKNSHPHRYYLIGIRSSGKFDCTDTTPDLFQSINHHMDWITESIAKLEATK